MQMYCTFVLFVNQHFSGLPASWTHCIKVDENADFEVLANNPLTWGGYLAIMLEQLDSTLTTWFAIFPRSGTE
jgi:hypothetical protein